MPFTVYENVALSWSLNVSVPDPTTFLVTFAGSNGWLLNGGPCVSYSVPLNTFVAVRSAVIDSHHARPFPSYVNQVAKMMSPWCARLMPQPDSMPAGDFHHSPS